MMLRRSFFLAALFSGAIVCSAGAQTAINADPLLQNIRAGLSLKEYVASVLQPFDAIADEAGQISAQDMRDLDSKGAASSRAGAIGALLRYDLNGDFSVSILEIVNAQTTAAQRAEAARKRKKRKTETLGVRQTRLARAEADGLIKRYDVNHDGAIDMKEIAQSVDQEEKPGGANLIAALFASPSGKDGKLTRTEVVTFAARTFYTIDKNRDERISSEEYAAASNEAENKIALR